MVTPKLSALTQWVRAAAIRPLARIQALLLVAALPLVGARPLYTQEPTLAPAADQIELVLLGTTDVHGYLYPYDYYTRRETDYGLARLKPLIDSVRAAHPGRVYLFDSGDLLQGNSLAYVYAKVETGRPSPVIRAMNLLEYTAAAIGNHEFNYGLAHLGAAIEQARFLFLSANIFRHGSTEHAYRPYVLIPHVVGSDTLLIGVTANTPPGVNIWDKEHVEGVLEVRDVVASLKPVVRELRARGADLVVVLAHGGLEGSSYDTAATGLSAENVSARVAREVPGIDVIFMGHTHRELADTTINGVLLTQARNWAGSLALAAVRLVRERAGSWRVAAKHAQLLQARGVAPDTAFLDSLRWEHERAVAYVKAEIGRASARMDARTARVQDTPILDFINEAQRRRAGADLSATQAFRLESALPEGPITVADIAGLYIYENTLKAVRVTGAQLKAYLEKSAEYYHPWTPGQSVVNREVPGYNFDVISGVDYVIDLLQPLGSRIRELKYRGRPVRPDQHFTLALNHYRQGGGGGYAMLKDAPVVYDRDEDIRTLLIEEVQARGTIRPEDYFQENWRIVPAAAAAAALAEQDRVRAAPATAPAAASRPRLRVLGMSEFHGGLLPFTLLSGRQNGGAATLASYFAQERRGFDGPTVLIDSGDLMQGHPISNLTSGRSVVDFYNAVGYHAAALGNHDFDWGQHVLRDRIAQARFHWLGANVFMAGADTAPSWVKPTAMIETPEGVRVGVVGLAKEDTRVLTHPDSVRGLAFGSAVQAVDRWVPELRRQGADFVIVTAHIGATCDSAGKNCRGEIIDLARTVQHRPDLIVAGHIDREVRTVVRGIPIVQTGGHGFSYAVVDLERITPDSVHAWIRGMPRTFADRVTPDSAIAALVDKYRAEIGPTVDRIVAALADSLNRRGGEYALGRLIADAQRYATGAAVAIMNNGGIRRELPAGPVTWGQLFEVQPFQNTLVRLRLTGAQLRAALEHAVDGNRPDAHVSGVVVWYDARLKPGNRIVTLELESGEPVRDDRIYTVVVNSFMASGGDRFRVFTEALAHEDTGIIDHDAMVAYLKTLPQPVRAPAPPRFRAVTTATTSPQGRDIP